MRFYFAAFGALFTVAFLAPNASADSGDDGDGIEVKNVQGAWVPTSRESDDWAASPASSAARSFAVMQDPAAPSAGAATSAHAVGAPVDAASAEVTGPGVAVAPTGSSGSSASSGGVGASAMPAMDPVTPPGASTEAAHRVMSDDHAGATADPHEGVLGMLRLGALAGVGAPSIFSGEGLAKIGDWVGVTGDYGAAPSLTMPVGIGGATISQTTVSAGARVFPFRGAFFVGGSVGQQTVTAKVTQSAEGVAGGANFSTKTMFVEPQIGLLYRFAFGLAIGCDAGLQIPVSGSGESSTTDNVPLPAQLSSVMSYAEKGVIPSLNILRLGYVL